MLATATIIAYQGPSVTQQEILSYLASWSGAGWANSLQLFALTFLVSAVWLIRGRLQASASQDFTLPILAWAAQTCHLLWSRLWSLPSHPVFVAGSLASAAIALIIVSAMIGLAHDRSKLSGNQSWLPLGLVPIATVVLDGAFALMCSTPLTP